MSRNNLIDDGLVALALLAGFGYAVYSLGPKALRVRCVAAAAALLGRLPAGFGLAGVAQRWAAGAAAKAGGSCGGCESCASNPAPTGAESARTGEVRIPLSQIGKR